MIIRFWGVRGSIPVPGKDTLKYGGNTTCIEVVTAAGDRIIIDAGTGIRVLGQELVKEEYGQGKGVAHIFFTHTHWDHIQGFPFFAPIYVGKRNKDGKVVKNSSNVIHIYGAANVSRPIEESLRGQMAADCYFPVALCDLSASLTFTALEDKGLKIGKTKIMALPLQHPNGVLGYRIEDEGKIVTIATDCEHPENGECDPNLLKLANRADLLIYDGQYTPEEYEPEKFNINKAPKKGFGHSTAEEGVKAADKAKVKRLIITHHEPLHDDKMLTAMEKKMKAILPSIAFAREGMEIVI